MILRYKKALALVATSVMIASLTACGGVAGNNSAGGGAPGSGDTYKLGLIAPFSGSENMYGDYMKNGALIAADEINAAGGVLGKKIEIVTEDDVCDPTQAAASANKLVSAGVVASVGGYCSGATLPTLPIFLKAQIPMIISVANSDNLLKDKQPNVFLVDGTGTQQAATALKWVQKKGYKQLMTIDDRTDYSANLAARFAEMATAAGLTVKTDSVTPKESDVSAQINKLKSTKADFLYFTGYAQEAGQIVKQAMEAGYTGNILLGDGSVDKKVSEVAGKDNAKDVYATFAMTPDMLEDGGAFAKKYAEIANGEQPGPYTIHSYDAVKVWAAAAEKAGSVTMDAVDAALHDLKDFTGLTGPLSFEADGSRSGGGGFVIVKVSEDGTFKLADKLEG